MSITRLNDPIIILSTCGSQQEAELIAKRLVEQQLAACVQITPHIQSIYRWEGEVCQDVEALLVVKTLKRNESKVQVCIKSLHSYSVPEVVSLAPESMDSQYQQWLIQETAH
ncbi:MAG: divalent-cation tolerance protein CutA [Pseudomonadota bacterium]